MPDSQCNLRAPRVGRNIEWMHAVSKISYPFLEGLTDLDVEIRPLLTDTERPQLLGGIDNAKARKMLQSKNAGSALIDIFPNLSFYGMFVQTTNHEYFDLEKTKIPKGHAGQLMSDRT